MITGRFLGDSNHPVNIHLCKDRTLSFRRRGSGEPVFNDVAVPVLSVRTEQEAVDLIMLVGTKQYSNHPHPRFKNEATFGWRKLFNGVAEGKQLLDPEDVPSAEEYLHDAYQKLLSAQES